MVANAGWSTERSSHPGAGRPCEAASNRGVLQATASTVNDTVSAQAAPTMTYSAGIGRSLDPPTPCANTMSPAPLPDFTSSPAAAIVEIDTVS